MAEEDQDQKTEFPTSKRLGEARDRGELPISREMATLTLFVGILLAMAFAAPMMANHLVANLRIFLESPEQMSLEGRGLQTIFYHVMGQTALATVFFFAIMAAAAILGTMLQTGMFYSLELIRPKFGKLSPISGLSRLFAVSSLVELGKSFGKMIFLGLMVYITLVPVVQELPQFADRDLIDTMAFLHRQAVHLIIMLMIVFTVIAVIDLLYQRFRYFKGLRMTRTEVKDEFRQQEGDPLIKNRLRQIRLEKARRRMMAQVPKADVIVTNPTHYAVALQYDSSKNAAPVVLAKGHDRVAERIRAVADENNIPMVSNPPLARALYDTAEIDREIPTQHYRAVAEVISYVYKLKKRKF